MANEKECSICYDPIIAKEGVSLNCNHAFHKECMSEWSKINKNCPYCRGKYYNFEIPKYMSRFDREWWLTNTDYNCMMEKQNRLLKDTNPSEFNNIMNNLYSYKKYNETNFVSLSKYDNYEVYDYAIYCPIEKTKKSFEDSSFGRSFMINSFI
jgi:hypothetical protein